MYRRRRDIDVFIDITDVTELRTHSISDEAIIIGGGVSLTETIQILQKATATPGFEYCEHLVKHIDLIANVPVRNVSALDKFKSFLTIYCKIFDNFRQERLLEIYA